MVRKTYPPIYPVAAISFLFFFASPASLSADPFFMKCGESTSANVGRTATFKVECKNSSICNLRCELWASRILQSAEIGATPVCLAQNVNETCAPTVTPGVQNTIGTASPVSLVEEKKGQECTIDCACSTQFTIMASCGPAVTVTGRSNACGVPLSNGGLQGYIVTPAGPSGSPNQFPGISTETTTFRSAGGFNPDDDPLAVTVTSVIKNVGPIGIGYSAQTQNEGNGALITYHGICAEFRF